MISNRKFLAGGASLAAYGSIAPLLPGSAGDHEMIMPFKVPAEEAPHQSCFMQLLVNIRVHDDPVFLDILHQTILSIANAKSDFEPVILLADACYHQQI